MNSPEEYFYDKILATISVINHNAKPSVQDKLVYSFFMEWTSLSPPFFFF